MDFNFGNEENFQFDHVFHLFYFKYVKLIWFIKGYHLFILSNLIKIIVSSKLEKEKF